MAASLSAASLPSRRIRSRAVLTASACFSSSSIGLTFTCICFAILNGVLGSATAFSAARWCLSTAIAHDDRADAPARYPTARPNLRKILRRSGPHIGLRRPTCSEISTPAPNRRPPPRQGIRRWQAVIALQHGTGLRPFLVRLTDMAADFPRTLGRAAGGSLPRAGRRQDLAALPAPLLHRHKTAIGVKAPAENLGDARCCRSPTG